MKSGQDYELVVPIGPSADEVAAAALEAKRAAALRALDDQRIAQAAKAPDAPAEVHEYLQALDAKVASPALERARA